MSLLKEKYQLSAEDTQTNIKIPFLISNEFRQLKIFFEYGPEHSSDEAARKQVEKAIEKYVFDGAPEEEYIVENYLPVENFVTVSLSKNDNYLGGHHNKSKQQIVTITEKSASLGFWPTEITPGEWELQLNCHCIASEELEATVRIEVIK